MINPRQTTRAAAVKAIWRRQDGAALVEFTLVLPVLLLLVIGMIEFGRAINYWIDANHLANVAARWAAVDRNPGADQVPSVSLQEYIRLQADTQELQDTAQVSICMVEDEEVGDPVEAVVSADFDWIPFLDSLGSTTLLGTATMRLEQAPPEAYDPDSCA